jgi:aldose 1-epimerase
MKPVTFQVRTESLGRVTGLDPTIYILEGDGTRAEIWPAQGFNCFRWTTQARTVDVLYADPKFLEGSSPTRTGIPILFPFPNRIRDGRFTWDGKEYQLPLNDPAKKNAIHGFACRRPWRVVHQGADASSAWVTGEFQGSRDAADCLNLWPADYRIRVTYRVGAARLAVEAVADNPDKKPLPCGLGYHPYFCVEEKNCSVQVPAKQYWELEETLPSGNRPNVSGMRDLNQPRPFQELTLDDVLTSLSGTVQNGMRLCGSIRRVQSELGVFTSAGYREVVVFTPPHRQAFCIEPYTCTTDAINLNQRGIDAGLMVLNPGQTWTGVVELRLL